MFSLHYVWHTMTTHLPILISREVVFVQEMPCSEPITSYMDTICRPILTQKKIKYEDLGIALIECKIEASQTMLRYADSFPFDQQRDWRGVDFPWETTNEPPVVGVLTTLRRKHGSWTPGSLTVVVFNISTLTFTEGIYYQTIGSADSPLISILQASFYEIGGENGCILVGIDSNPICGIYLALLMFSFNVHVRSWWATSTQ